MRTRIGKCSSMLGFKSIKSTIILSFMKLNQKLIPKMCSVNLHLLSQDFSVILYLLYLCLRGSEHILSVNFVF